MAKIDDVIYEISEPIITNNKMELVDVEFVKEGSQWFLRIFIDKDGGITLEDCELISRKISDKLDENDPIKQAYHLEVSSPGVERPLKKTKDFRRFLEHKVEINTFVAIEGKKKITGTLKKADDVEIIIEIEKDEVSIPREKISKAKLVFEF